MWTTDLTGAEDKTSGRTSEHSSAAPEGLLAGRGLGQVLESTAFVGLGEDGFDGLHQLASRLDAQLHRYSRSRAGDFIDEVDIEHVFES
jgi:hypothetical protein